jgi:hypothetical protein
LKAGDLVAIAFSETRRGHEWEKQVGIVIEVAYEPGYSHAIASVNFSGEIVKRSVKRLRIISESS